MPAPMKDLGPCTVIWDNDGTPINLNPYLGSVKWRDTMIHKDILEAGQGETPVDSVDAGRKVEIEISMTRFTLAQLATVIDGGTTSGGPPVTTLKVKNSVGNAKFATAKEIRIKPSLDNAASGTASQWMHFHRCTPVVDQEIAYDNDEQRSCKVLFKVFPDDESTRVGEMYRYGVET